MTAPTTRVPIVPTNNGLDLLWTCQTCRGPKGERVTYSGGQHPAPYLLDPWLDIHETHEEKR